VSLRKASGPLSLPEPCLLENSGEHCAYKVPMYSTGLSWPSSAALWQAGSGKAIGRACAATGQTKVPGESLAAGCFRGSWPAAALPLCDGDSSLPSKLKTEHRVTCLEMARVPRA
jgi:hypothetical protein